MEKCRFILIQWRKCQVLNFELYLWEWATDKTKRDVYIRVLTEREKKEKHSPNIGRFQRSFETWGCRIMVFPRVHPIFAWPSRKMYSQSTFNFTENGKMPLSKAMYLSHLHIKLNSIKQKNRQPNDCYFYLLIRLRMQLAISTKAINKQTQKREENIQQLFTR